MNLRVLKYLVEVIECGSYARAAERVHVSQPALSKAIRQLEEELDVVLLERGRRGTGVRLTAAGEIVVRHARLLFEGSSRMLFELEALRGLGAGELRFGLPALGSAEIFAPVIARFRECYPAISLNLLERGGEALVEAVLKDEIELAATILPLERDGLESVSVLDDDLVVALPRSHKLAAQRQVKFRDLAETPIVMFDGGYVLNRVILAACAQAGFLPKEVARTGQPSFGLSLVAAGAGAMLLPALVAQRYAVEGVNLVPLSETDLRWRLVMVWRKGAALSFAAQAFLAMLKQSRG
jgi:DNA-binding transcriptional LysR family regulator